MGSAAYFAAALPSSVLECNSVKSTYARKGEKRIREDENDPGHTPGHIRLGKDCSPELILVVELILLRHNCRSTSCNIS